MFQQYFKHPRAGRMSRGGSRFAALDLLDIFHQLGASWVRPEAFLHGTAPEDLFFKLFGFWAAPVGVRISDGQLKMVNLMNGEL